ncbi:hypothetical protein FSP39_010855 [Pinctada imbricata]|uniref:Beta-1,4-glucuronyltransferase 1 n=1 Tax=Pinctada imbricata TaxID=66713 RepID=A0AA89C4U5_PINIB|nr:hypothetical protein FSP39_010855 [Pinctada imbricata]
MKINVLKRLIVTCGFMAIAIIGYNSFLLVNRNYRGSDGEVFYGCSVRISSQINSVLLDTKWKEIEGAYCADRDDYFIIKDVFKTSKIRKLVRNSETVTIATQTTPNHIQALDLLAQRWDGPISVVVYLCVKDVQRALYSLINYRSIMVSFHFVAIDWDVENYSLCEMMMTTKTGFFNPREKRVPYPYSVLRNTAVTSVEEGYVFLTDIDMVPSANLNGLFLEHIKNMTNDRNGNKNLYPFISPEVYKLKFSTAYVIPAFEAVNSLYYARDKKELVSLVKRGFIRQCAIKSCKICQQSTLYNKWLSNPVNGSYSITLANRYYEPFYILHRSSYPKFDERFKDRGFDRISQVNKQFIHVEKGRISIMAALHSKTPKHPL